MLSQNCDIAGYQNRDSRERREHCLLYTSVCSSNLAKCLIINVLRLIIVILFFIAFLNITYMARHTFATTVTLAPVSYTHLDVYKRQGFSHPVTDHDATRKKATAAEKKRMAGTIMESGK